MRPAQPAPKDGPRINEEIRVREVQLIDQTGHNHGPTDIQIALARAQEAGLDLVEIAPNSVPPVCKILDFGKYKYQAQKKAAEARKKQKVVEIKEIKLRPMIDDHDYDVKMRSIQRFFEEGDKVKVTLRFRGREMAHQEFGFQKVRDFIKDLTPFGHPDSPPKLIGKGINVMLSPLPRNKRAKNPNQTPVSADEGPDAEPTPIPNNGKSERIPTNAAQNGAFSQNPFADLSVQEK